MGRKRLASAARRFSLAPARSLQRYVTIRSLFNIQLEINRIGFMNLDDLAHFKRTDPDRMIDLINGLPENLAEAWAAGQSISLDGAMGKVDRIAICGMGGSAISGEMLAALLSDTCPAPITVLREYTLPA